MNRRMWCAAVVAAMAGTASADKVSVVADRDNTLYQDPAGSLSNGAGENFFVGETAVGRLRRGLIHFDVAGAVPAGSTITAAKLTLTMNMTISADYTFRLHRSLKNWGEGTSVAGQPGNIGGGGGATSTTNDATWIHRFHNTSLWSMPGGTPLGKSPDYVAGASAAAIVGPAHQAYSWESTSTLVADVQSWLDSPGTNFGWFVIGGEGTPTSAKRFAARENLDPAARPTLTIEFTPPAGGCYADCDMTGTLNVNDFICFQGAFAAGNMALADCDETGTLNVNDFICFQSAFAAGCSAP